MIEGLLTEGASSAGRENILLEGRTYGLSAARYVRPDFKSNIFLSGPTFLSQ